MLVDRAMAERCVGAILRGTGTSEQKNLILARFFNRHLKSRNGNVLGALYCAAQTHRFGNMPHVEEALKKYESETQEVRDLIALRNRRFGLSEIEKYLGEFRGYAHFADILVQFRLAGVLADELVTWHALSDPKGVLEPLRRAGYCAREIIGAYENLMQKEFGGSRIMNAPEIVEALLKAGFEGKEIVIGLRQAGYTASEAGLGILGARVIINGGRDALRDTCGLDLTGADGIARKLVNSEMVAFAARTISAGYPERKEALNNMYHTFHKLKKNFPLEARLLIRIRDELGNMELRDRFGIME